ncbi:MAG: hypothetical protein IPL95_05390 [Saprospiraceae bacterium]|nr:hypothetical protein [Saprospiraceae bacterium]
MRYFIYVLLLFSNILAAQKNDYVWITGNVGDDLVFLDWGGTEINFNLNPISIKKNFALWNVCKYFLLL